MLRKILAITGRPGLFKIISNNKDVLLVEDLITGKRFPAHAREKILSLGDISMYTDSDDIHIGEVLDRLYSYADGKPVDVKTLSDKKGLRDYFGNVLENFDRERVYESDVKKLFTWYNILIEAGFTSFTNKSEAAGNED